MQRFILSLVGSIMVLSVLVLGTATVTQAAGASAEVMGQSAVVKVKASGFTPGEGLLVTFVPPASEGLPPFMEVADGTGAMSLTKNLRSGTPGQWRVDILGTSSNLTAQAFFTF